MAARRRKGEYWAGFSAVVGVALVATLKAWPVPDDVAAPLPQLLLGDRVLLGVLRLAILAGALYGIASVPALIVGGRWVKGLGTAGIVADEPPAEIAAFLTDADAELTALRGDNERLARERDELLSLIEIATRPG